MTNKTVLAKNPITLAFIVDYLKQSNIDARLMGDPSQKIAGLGAVKSATESEMTFITSDKFLNDLKNSQAGAVLLRASQSDKFDGNRIVVEDPYLSYAKITRLFIRESSLKSGIHPSAVIAASAKVSPSAAIGPNAVIEEDVVIGDNCQIYANVRIGERSVVGSNCVFYSNVSIYHDVKIGTDVIIHSSTVIGSDGFGFAPDKKGKQESSWQKIYQLGGVIIGNRVEIGASSTIDRGALEDTIIADGVIIDNQVHIAHNCVIGKNTALAGCTGVAGSTWIGENCTIAGFIGVNGHINIADNSHYLGGSIVTKGNSEGGVFASGSPLMEAKKWRRSAIRMSQLDDLFDRVKALEKSINK